MSALGLGRVKTLCRNGRTLGQGVAMWAGFMPWLCGDCSHQWL